MRAWSRLRVNEVWEWRHVAEAGKGRENEDRYWYKAVLYLCR